jgi:hypothetical protein
MSTANHSVGLAQDAHLVAHLDCTIHDRKTPRAELPPTLRACAELQFSFDHFNATLFDSALPHCIITLQRSGNCYGYFCAARFDSRTGQQCDEIALNPTHILTRPLREVLSTQAHEMVHFWQQHFGKPGRRGYHNRQWAQKMKSIGLGPSATGNPGGKETGQSISHYIIAGGAFDRSARQLASGGFALTWGDALPDRGLSGWRGVEGEPLDGSNPAKNRSNRVKYTCPGSACRANAWARPLLHLVCGSCGLRMLARGGSSQRGLVAVRAA